MKPEPTVIYESSSMIAVAKPAGLLVHPATRDGKEQTLVHWLRNRYPEVASVGDDPHLRPGIVHRLDRGTSGVMVIAKTSAAFAYLKQAFKDRRVRKTYLALVQRVPSARSGTITLPIARVGIKRVIPRQGRTRAVEQRDAITHWRLVRTLGDFALLEVTPETGRTNQIRVHLASVGHPIVCDRLYGGRRTACPPPLTRPFLHAAALELTTPEESRVRLEADLPDDLRETIRRLEEKTAA